MFEGQKETSVSSNGRSAKESVILDGSFAWCSGNSKRPVALGGQRTIDSLSDLMSRVKLAVNNDMSAVTSVEIDLELERQGNCANFGANAEISFRLNVGMESTSDDVSEKFEFLPQKHMGAQRHEKMTLHRAGTRE